MAKAAKKIKVIPDQITNAYLDYVLTHNDAPKSVYGFAKAINISEEEFYNHFASFEAIEKQVWVDLTAETIRLSVEQEIWNQYTAREKMLSFFYSFIELLRTKRSFIIFSLKKKKYKIGTPAVLAETHILFDNFSEGIINEGLESRELADRKFLSKRYKDALWLQFLFILNFWIDDDSQAFEKTDEAIEKGLNVTFDLFQHSPLDNLFEYGKFLSRNGKFREKMGI